MACAACEPDLCCRFGLVFNTDFPNMHRWPLRCLAGVVHCEAQQLGWRPLLQTWLAANPCKLSDRHAGMARDLAGWLFDPLLGFTERRCSHVGISSGASSVQRALELFAALLHRAGSSALTGTRADASLQGLFALATVWSIGGTLSAEVRALEHTQYRSLAA